MRAKNRSLLGILLGLVVGCALYSGFRALVPSVIAVGPAVIGFMAGVGARMGRAFGTPKQMRIIIFGGLAGFFATEYGLYHKLASVSPAGDFVSYILKDPTWLAFSLVFLVCGMLFGIRIIVGHDALADLMTHGNNPIDSGGTGTECPRCNSLQTVLDRHSLQLDCQSCGHRWRAEDLVATE